MKKINEKILFAGKWISVKEAVFLNKENQELSWEFIKRENAVSSVIVVPILIPSKRFVIIKQYRPAINDYILAFPAGLSDGNDAQALIELKEETGYVGRVINRSPMLQINFGLMDEKSQTVVVHIDEGNVQNQNPQQDLEPTEEIEVILVEHNRTREFLLNEARGGVRIAAGLWYVLGLDLSI